MRCIRLAFSISIHSLAFASGLAADQANVFVAHVSSHRTMEDAQKALDSLRARMAPDFEVLKPFIGRVALGKKGNWYRLRVGPPMSKGDALALCLSIKNAGEPYCEVADAFALSNLRPGYYGSVELAPLEDGRNMAVLKPFGFVDGQARAWEVPAGAVTDGASIPRALWSLVGSPYTGKYLKAAIVHDYYTQTKHRSWEATHDAFYEAMLASGVESSTALLMWAGVYRFGPRWAEGATSCGDTCAGGNINLDFVEIEPQFIPKEFERLKDYISAHPRATKEQLLEVIDQTYWPDDSYARPYPARMRGYVSDGVMPDSEADGPIGPKEPDDWIDGPSHRRYIDAPANTRWPGYSSADYEAGDELSPTYFEVVDVAKNDTLAVHASPNATSAITHRLPRDATCLRIERRCMSMWCKVYKEGVSGYVNTRYLDHAYGCEPRRVDDKTVSLPKDAPPSSVCMTCNSQSAP